MPILVADHRLKDFNTWMKLFGANPPPEIGQWRLARGIGDPNRVQVIAELDESEVDAVKEFLTSERMQAIFKKVNEMSTRPIEFIWLDEITPD